MKTVFTTGEAAKICKVSQQTIIRCFDSGQLKGFRVPGSRFEVRSVNNGFDAGMMVKEYRPDVIVLDVMLPDINGREVCQRVRSDRSMDDVRIVCISGMVEEDKIAELRTSGANDFLHKPFEVDELVDRICMQLDVEAMNTA